MKSTNETLLNVEGMTCQSCIRHVDEALRGVEGVCSVDVQLREGKVQVEHGEETSIPALIDALREAGYEASPAS